MLPWYNTISFWVISWFLLYIADIVPYNPKLFLIILFLLNFTQIPQIKSTKGKLSFLLYSVVGKLIPLYLLRNTQTTTKDNIFGVILVLIHIVYLRVKNIDIYNFYIRDIPRIWEKIYGGLY